MLLAILPQDFGKFWGKGAEMLGNTAKSSLKCVVNLCDVVDVVQTAIRSFYKNKAYRNTKAQNS